MIKVKNLRIVSIGMQFILISHVSEVIFRRFEVVLKNLNVMKIS